MSSILDQDIQFLPSVGPKTKEILSKELGIRSYGDLLEYYPYKYVDRSKIFHISELTSDMPFVQLKGKDPELRGSRYRQAQQDARGAFLRWLRRGRSGMVPQRPVHHQELQGRNRIHRLRQAVPPTTADSSLPIPDIDDASKHCKSRRWKCSPCTGLTENMKKRGYTSRSIERITRQPGQHSPSTARKRSTSSSTACIPHPRYRPPDHPYYPHSHQEMQKAQEDEVRGAVDVQLNILGMRADQRSKYRGYIFNRIGDIFNGLTPIISLRNAMGRPETGDARDQGRYVQRQADEPAPSRAT